MDLLKDKSALLTYLLKVIEDSDREREGLTMLRDSLVREDPNHSIDNIARCLSTTMKITAKQSDQLRKISVIALIMAQSSDFDADVAKMLNKMGKGEEALKQMFENKLKGK